jgi:UDPglucose 6-dehydrogenase
MNITVFGAGYVGLVSAVCFAEMGNHVLCVEQDTRRLELLKAGQSPIVEPGLDALLASNSAAGRLAFTSHTAQAVEHGRVLFIAVGTPAGEDGCADLRDVFRVASQIGQNMSGERLVVLKSTAPVGTVDELRQRIQRELKSRRVLMPLSVASNPEFLKQGAAVDDFMRPARIVIGTEDADAETMLRELYAPFLRNRDRVLCMDIRSAELTKYAANAMLATRISFMNELARLAEVTGADIEHIRHGIGSDPRIGTHFLYAGCGYGGSCLPKDVQALLSVGRKAGVDLSVLAAVHDTNQVQQELLVQRAVQCFGEELGGRRLAVWGLAFKPGTDDVRDAPALRAVRALSARGAAVHAWDPVAQAGAERELGLLDGLRYFADPIDAADGADALLIFTEWRALRSPDLASLHQRMRRPLILDGRNLYQPQQMAELGFEYVGVGRGQPLRAVAADAALRGHAA